MNSDKFESLFFGFLFLFCPMMIISGAGLLEAYSMPYRWFIYGFWIAGIPVMASIVLHDRLRDYDDTIGEHLDKPVISILIFIIFCIWPFILALVLCEKTDIVHCVAAEIPLFYQP